jgi:hypothetical protein
MQASNGVYYGTTMAGGTDGQGVIYSIAPLIVSTPAGVPFSYQVATISNTTSSLYLAQNLPPGLAINSSTGLISGTPTIAGTTTVTLGATNPGGTGYGSLTITVSPPPSIISPLIATEIAGSSLNYQIGASNGPALFAASGLPAGLSLNSTTGLISGTVAASGSSPITISAANASGTASATLIINVIAPPPVISDPSSAFAPVDNSFSFQINGSNNPNIFGLSNLSLPGDLTFSSSTGLISGICYYTGTYSFTISASNFAGTGTAGLNIVCGTPMAPVVTGVPAATGTIGLPFAYQIIAANYPTGFAAANLPAGLTVNTATGLISGTIATCGNSAVIVTATNAVGSGTASLIITSMDSFGAWQQQWFSAAQIADSSISAATAMPAGDGVPNLLKYAFNLNSFAPSPNSLPLCSLMPVSGTNYLTFEYVDNIFASGISYIPEVSSDLQNWFSGSSYIVPVSTTPNGDGMTETVIVRSATPVTSGTSQFIHLKVTSP